MNDTSVSRNKRIVSRRKWEALRMRLKKSLSARFYLRLHMSLILALAWLAGLVAAWMLKWWGMTNLSVRYTAAVLVAYLFFVMAIAIWVRLLEGRRSHMDFDPGSLPDLLQTLPPRGCGGGHAAGETAAEGAGLLELIAGAGEGLLIAGLVVGLIALSVASGLYLIWEAPVIAVEGILEIVLATGMLRVSGVDPAGGVARYVLRRTWWIAGLALLSALVAGNILSTA